VSLNIGELVAYLKMNKADWDSAKAGAKRDLDDIADEAEKSGKKVDKSTKDTAKKVESNFSAMAFGGALVRAARRGRRRRGRRRRGAHDRLGGVPRHRRPRGGRRPSSPGRLGRHLEAHHHSDAANGRRSRGRPRGGGR
jgi:hypothetical protein